jgi:hypothetical protein
MPFPGTDKGNALQSVRLLLHLVRSESGKGCFPVMESYIFPVMERLPGIQVMQARSLQWLSHQRAIGGFLKYTTMSITYIIYPNVLI